MKTFAVFDIETDPFLHGRIPEPFVCEFYDGVTCEIFYSIQDAAKFISEYDGIVYAHNGGKFDWHYLLPYVDAYTDVMVINGRLSKIKLGKAELRDSWNILPIPLGDYQKDEIDYAIFEKGEREKPHNKKKIEQYLHMDCVYLFGLVQAFYDRHGCKLTQASAALSECERKIGVKFPHSTAEYFDRFKPFYFGGRVQAFSSGYAKENVQVYDINSAYPAAMLKQHPFDLSYRHVDTKKGAAYAYDAPHAFFTLRAVARGCFPWREKVGEKNIYPADNEAREYYVTGWELCAALDTGTVEDIEIIDIIEHIGTRDFSDFILPVFAERKAAKECGDKATDILCKLAANSVYGKTGSDPRNYSKSYFFPSDMTPELCTNGVIFNGQQYIFEGAPCDDLCIGSRPLTEAEACYYNVATAASITGHVRAFLWRAICAAEGVLYVDTDSLFCRAGGALAVGNDLGEWKHEGEFSHWAIVARKIYCLFTDEGWQKTFDSAEIKWREKNKLLPYGKIASKGATLNSQEILALARGDVAEIVNDKAAPSYSISNGIRFTSRTIRPVD